MAKKRRPHGSSVTSIACKCNGLERAAEEPGVPIVFDDAMNEYHLVYRNKKKRGYMMIYHCMFCGGAAPLSRRATFFASITGDERERLMEKTAGFKSLDEAVAQLGKPDSDLPAGMTTMTTGSDAEPPTVKSFRVLHYLGLSKTADVHIIDLGPDRGVRVQLQGKYLGRPKQNRANAKR